MKLLLTGASGFLGGQLASRLAGAGHSLVALVRPSSDLTRISKILSSDRIINAADYESLEQVFQRYSFDGVIHCATEYGRDPRDIRSVFEANLSLFVRLLDLAMKTGVRFFMNSDTFFNQDLRFSDFIAHQRYLQTYVLTKRQVLEWGRYVALVSHLQFINMRIEHMYGPGDGADKFLPQVIAGCIACVPKIHLANGGFRRDFIYVDDVVEAFVTVLTAGLEQPERFIDHSVGTGVETSIEELVRCIIRLSGANTEIANGQGANRHLEVKNSCGSPGSLAELGWQPHWTLEAGLKKYIKEEAARRDSSTA